MIKHFLLPVFLLFYFVSEVAGQEHNFSVGPQRVNCDSLELTDENAQDAIKKIRETSFRFQQSIRVNRSEGFQEGHFYSCNNEDGFMIVKFDEQSLFYRGIPKALWDEMAASNNPEDFFVENIRQKIKQWKQHPQ